MPLPQEKQLGELRDELAARVGRAYQGSSGSINKTLLNSFLQDAQEQLYEKYRWKRLFTTWQLNLGQAQQLLDYPLNADTLRGAGGDCNPDLIKEIRVQVDTNFWYTLTEGIEAVHDTVYTNPTYPRKFERLDQIEFWPNTDKIYTIQIDGYPFLYSFTLDADRCTIQSRAVFLLALINAKAHYGQKDAKVYEGQLTSLIKRHATRVHGTKRYIPGNPGTRSRNNAMYPRPVIET